MSRKKPARFSLSNQDRDILIKSLKTLFASDEQIEEVLNYSKIKYIWNSYNNRKDFTYLSNCIGDKIIIPFSNIPLNPVEENKGDIKNEGLKLELNNVSDIKENKIITRTRGKGKKASKTVISFALNDKSIQLLSSHADDDERSLSAVLRLAVRDYINKYELGKTEKDMGSC